MLSFVNILRNKWHFAFIRLDVRHLPLFVAALIPALPAGSARAADNELSASEKAAGWVLLFDGKSTKGWKNNDEKPVAAKIEEGAINAHGAGGYVLVYDRQFGDFELSCDVKMDRPTCNSGIFFRIGDLKDPVQTGFEAQVVSDEKPDVHGFGALYDLVAPVKNAARGPGKWDTVVVRCQGPHISITVNGAKVASLDCDAWTEPGKRLDGTSHKFAKSIKDFPRKGYLGVQDHGDRVWYKNIKLRELPAK